MYRNEWRGPRTKEGATLEVKTGAEGALDWVLTVDDKNINSIALN